MMIFNPLAAALDSDEDEMEAAETELSAMENSAMQDTDAQSEEEEEEDLLGASSGGGIKAERQKLLLKIEQLTDQSDRQKFKLLNQKETIEQLEDALEESEEKLRTAVTSLEERNQLVWDLQQELRHLRTRRQVGRVEVQKSVKDLKSQFQAQIRMNTPTLERRPSRSTYSAADLKKHRDAGEQAVEALTKTPTNQDSGSTQAGGGGGMDAEFDREEADARVTHLRQQFDKDIATIRQEYEAKREQDTGRHAREVEQLQAQLEALTSQVAELTAWNFKTAFAMQKQAPKLSSLQLDDDVVTPTAAPTSSSSSSYPSSPPRSRPQQYMSPKSRGGGAGGCGSSGNSGDSSHESNGGVTATTSIDTASATSPAAATSVATVAATFATTATAHATAPASPGPASTPTASTTTSTTTASSITTSTPASTTASTTAASTATAITVPPTTPKVATAASTRVATTAAAATTALAAAVATDTATAAVVADVSPTRADAPPVTISVGRSPKHAALSHTTATAATTSTPAATVPTTRFFPAAAFPAPLTASSPAIVPLSTPAAATASSAAGTAAPTTPTATTSPSHIVPSTAATVPAGSSLPPRSPSPLLASPAARAHRLSIDRPQMPSKSPPVLRRSPTATGVAVDVTATAATTTTPFAASGATVPPATVFPDSTNVDSKLPNVIVQATNCLPSEKKTNVPPPPPSTTALAAHATSTASTASPVSTASTASAAATTTTTTATATATTSTATASTVGASATASAAASATATTTNAPAATAAVVPSPRRLHGRPPMPTKLPPRVREPAKGLTGYVAMQHNLMKQKGLLDVLLQEALARQSLNSLPEASLEKEIQRLNEKMAAISKLQKKLEQKIRGLVEIKPEDPEQEMKDFEELVAITRTRQRTRVKRTSDVFQQSQTSASLLTTWTCTACGLFNVPSQSVCLSCRSEKRTKQ